MTDVRSLEAKGDVPGLIQVLGVKTESIRGAAAEALGKIGDPAALHPIPVALCDDRSGGRMKEARALGSLGEPAAGASASGSIGSYSVNAIGPCLPTPAVIRPRE